MRKTQAIGPSQDGPASRPAFSVSHSVSKSVPVALFVLAYVAILGVLFAPEGYFNGEQPAVVTPDQP